MKKTTVTILDDLYTLIASRRTANPETSYTAKLYHRGRGKIVQKLGEEAVETVIAGMENNKAEIISESSDLLYHLLVLWADAEITPTEIWEEMNRRMGTSGINEKKARSKI